jgi:putative transposase
LGCLLSIVVHAANIHDTKSGINPAKKAFDKYPTIKKFCGDEGYRKSFVDDVKKELKLEVDISEKIVPGWAVIAKRWIVERTFAWAGYSRRLAKDYEISIHSAETMFKISHIHTLLRSVVKS